MGRSILTGNTEDKINILNNETPYTPTGNYNLATKKYVDDGLSAKQPALVSGTNIKTINNTSLLGNGNITIEGGKFYGIDTSRILVTQYGSVSETYTATEDSIAIINCWDIGTIYSYLKINGVQLPTRCGASDIYYSNSGGFFIIPLKQGDIVTMYTGTNSPMSIKVFGIK